MINWFYQFKTKKLIDNNINFEDISKSKKILFCLFSRYGDTIINLVVIKEFIEEHPNKDYLILCPKQMQPYVHEIVPNIRSIGINKRNFFEIFKINIFLKKWVPDIGFNPWSNGFESCYLLSYCKKYKFYKNFFKPKVINHYQVVRKYLNLKEKKWDIEELSLKKCYKKILICPQSTDIDRSISNQQLDAITYKAKFDFKALTITIASLSSEYFRSDYISFGLKKNAKTSKTFIQLLKNSDLIICADSAPLHLANALNKDVIAVFNFTKPEIVINSGDKLSIFKD